jgi:hypothetical protein
LSVPFAQVALTTAFHWQELWTVVQWQDRRGKWHEVEGWRGTLDEIERQGDEYEGSKVWWVSKSDFEKGPFRWLVYRTKGGSLVAESDPFSLPHFIGEIVKVETSPAL